MRREEEKHSPPQPSPALANKIQAEVTILNEQYGPMVALARMIEYGYLPALNLVTVEDIKKG